jgi:hypothetical protein
MNWLTLFTCAGQSPVAGNVNILKTDQLVSFTKSESTTVQTNVSTNHLNTDFENVKSIIVQFTVGIIKLNSIALTVMKNQATARLSLWDQYVILG